MFDQSIVNPAVGRKNETDLVQEKIAMISFGGAVVQAIINFFGVVGIGKTSLLNQIYLNCQEQKIPVVLINLGAHTYQKPDEGYLAVFNDILQEVPHAGLSLQAFQQAQAQMEEMLRPPEADPKVEMVMRQRAEQMEVVKNEFRALMNKWMVQNERVPLVLLFDNTDKAEPALLDWLEESVISPLIRTDQAVAIFAGRSPVRWKRFEVRRRVYQYKLQPFDLVQTRKQIQRYTVLSDKIIGLTFGHPFGNRKVAEKVYRLETEDQANITLDNFDHYRLQLMDELVRDLIDTIIMEKVHPELKQALRIISVLRHFDVNALRVMLTKFHSAQWGGKGGGYYLSMVARMVETTLVEWDSVRKGYAIDFSVRRMLALHLQLSDQVKYLAINHEAINLYKEWIERIPENRSGFIIEYIYHRSNILKINNTPDDQIGNALANELIAFLGQYYIREMDTPAVMRLREDLSNDVEILENIPGELHLLVDAVDRFIHDSQ